MAHISNELITLKSNNTPPQVLTIRLKTTMLAKVSHTTNIQISKLPQITSIE